MPLRVYNQKKLNSNIKSTLAVLSGKGGVGKSTVAVHLALTFKKMNKKVGILDADLYGPSLGKMLPVKNPILEKDEVYFPATSQGIKIISMAYFKNESESLAMRAPIANQIIDRFLHQVIWDDLDWLIIDFPPGTGDIGLSLCQKAIIDGAAVVTTPQEVAMIDVKKSINMLSKFKIPIFGIIENMSAYYHPITKEKIHFFGKDGGKRLAADQGVPFLGEIPLHPGLSHRCDEGCTDKNNVSEADDAFLKITRNILGHHELNNSNSNQFPFEAGKDFFILTFKNGKKRRYSFNLIQKNCPCANCIIEKSPSVQDLGVSKITPVGRYALSFSFDSGCSHGIYSYDFLQKLGDEIE